MAKGEFHSTGTVCTAELRPCPLESSGGHFNSLDELVDHTAEKTGSDAAEMRSVLASGVSPTEVISMANEGILGGSTAESAKRAPKRPATIKIDLTDQTSDTLKKGFLRNLNENGFPVVSSKDDGMGNLTVTVEAESDPNDYSLLMAATSSAESAAFEMGLDSDELEQFQDSLTVSAELDPEPQPAPLKPSEVKELNSFDPSVHSVFSNAAARNNPSIAARALNRELKHGEWLDTLADQEQSYDHQTAEESAESAERVTRLIADRDSSRARQSAMVKEMLWLSDNDSSYAEKLPRGAHSMLRGVRGTGHEGISIGTVRKAPLPKK